MISASWLLWWKKWGQSPIIASRITKRDSDPTYFPGRITRSALRSKRRAVRLDQRCGSQDLNYRVEICRRESSSAGNVSSQDTTLIYAHVSNRRRTSCFRSVLAERVASERKLSRSRQRRGNPCLRRAPL